MRYIGGKGLMVDNIMDVVRECTDGVQSVLDVFSGSGIVARTFKEAGYSVSANDVLYFSYAVNKGTLENNRTSKKLRELLAYLNNLPMEAADPANPDNFIAHNYSPNGDCERMYFQNRNALKIDLIRQEIEHLRGELTEKEYFYLLASLLCAVPYVANITGTYAAYLKYWDARTYKDLVLEELPVISSRKHCKVYNMEAEELVRRRHFDLAYLDPPYNEREYLPNYHILETIARYDHPEIKGITGMRVTNDCKSNFCRKNLVREAFNHILQNLHSRYVLISYNNEGLLPTEELIEIVRNNGIAQSFRLFEYEYRRYKNKIPNNSQGLKEQLYFIER